MQRHALAQSELDRFVLAGLEAKGLKPAPPADKRTLIRRATFDLHGLPPTPEEIQAFLADDDPHAFERLVDRLLASPHYGERWGRHWLDVARYADSNGADENRIHANAWRYRDYVMACFNDDVPYDRFIVEQLAGDLLPAPDTDDAQPAVDRHRLSGHRPQAAAGQRRREGGDGRRGRADRSRGPRAFLGLTLGCARCHDHKFDPISAERLLRAGRHLQEHQGRSTSTTFRIIAPGPSGRSAGGGRASGTRR